MKKRVLVSSLFIAAGALAAAGYYLYKKGVIAIEITDENDLLDDPAGDEENLDGTEDADDVAEDDMMDEIEEDDEERSEEDLGDDSEEDSNEGVEEVESEEEPKPTKSKRIHKQQKADPVEPVAEDQDSEE